MVHSASIEPDEEPYCENCDNFEDNCTCDVGYREERDFD